MTAVCWSVSGLAFEDCGRRIGSLSVNILRLVIAFVLLGAFGLATRGLALPSDATPRAWLWLSISGLVGFTLGGMCLFRAYVLIGARLSLLLMTLVPPAAALLGWVLLGERLLLVDWLAMGLVVGGVLFLFIGWWPAVVVSTKNLRAMETVTLGALFGTFLAVAGTALLFVE